MSESKLTEKFTTRAKKVIAISVEEARALGAPMIDTEHLLLGILQDDDGVAAKILRSFKIDSEHLREMIMTSTNAGEFSFTQNGFSEAAQEALSNAALSAYICGHSYIGTEHILCGLAKTSSGLASHILRSHGLTFEAIRNRMDQVASYPETNITNVSEKNNETPLLNQYGRDLTAMARLSALDPVIGRDQEISRCLLVLGRRTKNNPVLLGESGVGKTAIVEGLAQKIVKREVPKKFFNYRLINLDLSSVVAGTRFRGDFEERLVSLLEEIREAKNVIIFIDEIHNLVGAGGAGGGSMDAANILKPALSRGEIRVIGATTVDEYSQFVEEDAALERRFQPIYVEEPNKKITLKILEGLKDKYEQFHGLKIKHSALEIAVDLAHRYLTERHLPDSAIDLVDEAASKKAIAAGMLSTAALKLQRTLEEVREDKNNLVKEEDFASATQIRDQEKKILGRLNKLVERDFRVHYPLIVNPSDIMEVVSQVTGIPTQDLDQSEEQRLLSLEKELSSSVLGQEEAVKEIAKVLRRSRVGLNDPDRPLGSFLFLGPTGVGKSLVAKELARLLFDDPEALIKLDMSEFSEKHTVSRLLGAPPGYVGYEEGGELTTKLRRRPFSVILLDEIEKAHPDIFNSLLQVLEEGQLIDGKGRVVNFRQCVVIMTSNLGAESIKKGYIGFSSLDTAHDQHSRIKEQLTSQLKNFFKPEFLNRLDKIVIFQSLNKNHIRNIAKLEVAKVSERLLVRKIKVGIDNEVYDFLTEKGYSEEYGARPMKRAVAEYLEDPLSEELIRGKYQKGDSIKIVVKNESLSFH